MKDKKVLLLAACMVSHVLVFAQKQAPVNWFNLDPKKDKVYGVSSERTYTELLQNRTPKPVIVAVIDGGTEPTHEDLKAVVWVNEKEVAGNGVDDDKNGYIDDVNGWNFIGGKDGSDVDQDNLEVTRLYAEMKPKYDQADTTLLSASERAQYYQYVKVRKEYFKGKQEYTSYYNLYGELLKGIEGLKKHIGKEQVTMAELKAYKAEGPEEVMAQKVIEQSFKKLPASNPIPFTALTGSIEEAYKQSERFVKYSYNTDLDTRKIVGDHYEDLSERYYGNNDVQGPSGGHGTHVAGIIGAVRNNGMGMNGVAQPVKILIVRVVPDGDERDKDVANGIRYAVDNGAKVINMSFGKSFSPQKGAVDEAVKYAMSKDVLMVHGSGNDAANTEHEDNFPSPRYLDGSGTAESWIEVGASSWLKGKDITAQFSNYGQTTVDVFAPGVDIFSTVPTSQYATYDGTSMASPVTAGVAALIRAYHPELTAPQVKEIILKSVTPVKGKVLVPGTKKKVKMKELCRTGGIVNAYEAMKLADAYGKK